MAEYMSKLPYVGNLLEQRTIYPMSDTPSKPTRRTVPARLTEATPDRAGLGQWALASPMLIFVGWLAVDIFSAVSPIPWRWLDILLGSVLYVLLIVLPLGMAAHWLVTAFPRPFQHSGWDVTPLEPVPQAEIYMVRYDYVELFRAETTWSRRWLRAAQGWVYLEIFAIFAGAILMIPLFFSAAEFGFGQ